MEKDLYKGRRSDPKGGARDKGRRSDPKGGPRGVDKTGKPISSNTMKDDAANILNKSFKEAKDSREYGYEGEMVISQLKGIISHSEQLHDMLKPDTDLPEWVQSKITLAYDYIQTAADYMATELDEDMAVPTNNAGGGKIAAIGVGPQGEPGVSKKRNPILQPTEHRKSLSDFIRGN
jgi:hypothetical protein